MARILDVCNLGPVQYRTRRADPERSRRLRSSNVQSTLDSRYSRTHKQVFVADTRFAVSWHTRAPSARQFDPFTLRSSAY